MRISASSKVGRILKAIQDNYPISVSELSKLLGMGERELKSILNELEKRGIIGLDVLPDKAYPRSLVPLSFYEASEEQKRFVKRRKRKKVRELPGYL